MSILVKELRPRALYVLVGLLAFQGVSALFGGFMLIADPTGAWLQMPLAQLEGTPFQDYLIPGLILFLVLGVYPLVVAQAFWNKRPWPLATRLAGLTGMHWAWLASVSVGVALVIWIVVQGLLIGFGHPLQVIYLLLGLALVGMTLVPSVRRYGAAERQAHRSW